MGERYIQTYINYCSFYDVKRGSCPLFVRQPCLAIAAAAKLCQHKKDTTNIVLAFSPLAR